jgi:hypothetical protein
VTEFFALASAKILEEDNMKIWPIYMNEPIMTDMKSTTIQSSVGGEQVILEQVSETVILEWMVNSSSETRQMMEHHQDFVRYHQGGLAFFWDGGENGKLSHKAFLGYGNATRTDFQLPLRWPYKQSLVATINNVVSTAWSMVGRRVLRFTSAPADGAHIHLTNARMTFKAYIVAESDMLYQMEDNFKSFGSKSIRIREHAF